MKLNGWTYDCMFLKMTRVDIMTAREQDDAKL